MNESRFVNVLQIYVGGPTLAHGYLNRPKVQAKRFIPRPDLVASECGDILYRSGDWGYMLSDGRLEICGRCDTMVKVRGYSIEVQVCSILKICLVSQSLQYLNEQLLFLSALQCRTA